MAEKKQGVGIWEHFRTTDRADGLEFRGFVNDESVDARLYWAPADFKYPQKSDKCPYLVVKVYRGKFDSFCGYEQELRWDAYVGKSAKRRSWKTLVEIAEQIDLERLGEYVDDAIWYHETMISLGCEYKRHTYYFPQGKMEQVYAQVRKEWKKRKAK